jgi:ABC-type multidrug transport system ATPase subunit
LSLREEITRFSKTDKKTIIITSHNTEQLEKLCDRYGILNKGKLIEFSKEEQVENGSLETVYIKILRGEQSWQ